MPKSAGLAEVQNHQVRRANIHASLVEPSGVVLNGFDRTLAAVRSQLRQIAAGSGSLADGESRGHGAHTARPDVMACLATLDQLRAAMRGEARKCRQLEREVSDIRTTLELTRVELAGTRAQESHARHLASHDRLTGLPNGSLFREKLGQALDQGRRNDASVAVLYLDLDDFKRINDTHGHDTGDSLLKIVAARLLRAVRAGDTVSRLGGDEFACMRTGFTDTAQLDRLARKLSDVVGAPVTLGNLILNVRTSIGIATCPDDGVDAETLLTKADTAMYRVKRSRSGQH